MRIAMTGANGIMGREAVMTIMENASAYITILLRTSAKNRAYASQLKRKYKQRIDIIFGDVRDYEDCVLLTRDADYVLHLAAVIPPKADHHEEMTVTTNFNGTVNMVNAVIENGNHAKFIYISTVAVYGNRDEKHPWGRVGDPLLPSAFDVYGTSKLRAERYLLESKLNSWVVLRQTGILYDNLLMNNIKDGLMFHTPWNVPIEWVTAKESGVLLKNVIEADNKGRARDFWKKVYNIGGGEKSRQTGYETFNDGFKLISGSVKEFFEPRWNMTRNFHCFWFSDSDILEDKFHFRSQGCNEFWAWFKSRHRLYSVARLIPSAVLRNMFITPLLKNNNAPEYWLKHGDTARVQACFGGTDAAAALPSDWKDYNLLCESSRYSKLKIFDKKYNLNHGYDETKPDDELDISDMRQAAAFRGGKCLSEKMTKGDLHTKLTWQCHDGHIFESSPYTVLKAGHWCSICCLPDREWRFDSLAKHIPFFAQVWNDTHEQEENFIYGVQDGISCLTIEE